MRKVILFVIFSCIVSLLSVHEVVAQRGQGGGQFGGQGGQRPPGGGQGGPPGGGQRPDGGQRPSGEQRPDGEQPAADPEGGEDPPKPIVPPSPPANSLSGKLLNPSLASLLHLTPEQSNQIVRIISAQTEEIRQANASNAPEERYLEIYKQNEEKLAQLLTPTQRAVLEQGIDATQYSISVQNMQWKEFLQFIADQGGYTLMMDAPPTGTANFIDQEKRTILEVLDHVNSLLIINGFTVTRKDRILLVLDLKKPIPNWSFPSAKPEELSGRAGSEFVSVNHQMGRRDPATVMARIKQFENPFSRITQIGNQVLVIDRVEIQNAIKTTIQNIEEPPVPRQQEQRQNPPNPPPPEWRKYTIEKIEPEKAIEVFREYVSSLRMIRLENSRILNIFAQPAQHRQLEELLKMMEDDAGAMDDDDGGTGGSRKEGANTIRTYPIAPYMEPQGVPQDWRVLQRMQQMQQQRTPGEGFVPGQGPGQRGQRGQFGGGQGPGGGGAPLPPVIPQGVDPSQLNQVQVFGLELISILRRMFPDATITDMPIADRIVISASEADHESINEFLETLKPTGEKVPALKFYRFTDTSKKMTDTTVMQLQALVPTATMSLDVEQGQILVVATAKDHTTIAGLVRELESATAPVQGQIMVPYRLSSASFPAFLQMIQQLVAQDKLRGYSQTQDTLRNQVFIWATAEQHELIREMYAEITGQSQQVSDTPAVADAVVLFSPKNISMETLLSVLEDIYPTARITEDMQRKQLIIRVRPEQKVPLQELLSQLDADEPDGEKRYFKAYPIEIAFYSIDSGYNYYRPINLMSDLEKLAPRAKIVFDAQTQSLVVWGTDEEQAVIAEAIRHLLGDGKEKVMDRIQLRRMTFFSINPVLRRMYPAGAYTQADDQGRSLIVEGHPKLIAKVKELIELLDPEEPSENDPIAMFYKFEKEPTYAVLEGLRQLVPRAYILSDTGNKQIMVVAKPSEQKIIEKSTDLIVKSFREPEKEIRRFPLRRLPQWTIEYAIRRKFPEVDPMSDYAAPGLVLVEGDPLLLAKVEEFINIIDPLEPTENDPVIMYYTLKTAPTAMMITSLRALVSPSAQIATDWENERIMVVAKPSDHEILKRNTEAISASFAEPDREIKRFTPNQMTAYQLQSLIRRTYPSATITFDNSERYLVVQAHPELMAKISAMVETVDPSGPTGREIKRFIPNRMGAYQMQTVIRRMYPTATASYDSNERYLVVEATPELMPKITELVETLDPTEPTDTDPVAKFYALKSEPSPTLIQGLQQLVPSSRATIIADRAGKQVMVVARPLDHKIIEASVEVIASAFAPPEEQVLTIYTVTRDERDRLETFIRTLQQQPQFQQFQQGFSQQQQTELRDVRIIPDRSGAAQQQGQFQQDMPFQGRGGQGGQAGGPVPTNRITIYARPTDQKIIASVLEKIRESQENAPERKLQTFPMSGSDLMLAQNILRVSNPDAMLFPDASGNRLMVWTTVDDMEKVTEALETFTALEDPTLVVYTATQDERDRLEAFIRAAVNELRDVQIIPDRGGAMPQQPRQQQFLPDGTPIPMRGQGGMGGQGGAQSTGQVQSNRITIYARPMEHKLIANVLKQIQDSQANAPERKLKSFQMTNNDLLVAQNVLRASNPDAMLFPDVSGNRLMVWTTDDDMEKVTEALSAFTEVDAPQLIVYSVSQDEKDRLEAFIRTAVNELRDVKIVPDRGGAVTPQLQNPPVRGQGGQSGAQGTQSGSSVQSNQITIYARPMEHELIAAVLKQIRESQANAPERQLKSFQMSVGDMTVAQNILTTSHPDAMLFPDEAGHRLMVWATAEDLKKVTETLRIQGSIDDRQMMPYPIAGASLETAKTVITDVYQGLKITEEPLSRKLLVWASPDEHVKVGEIIEQINKEVDPDSELAEKFLTYSTHNIDIPMVTQLFEKLLPNADIHATPGSDKIVVRAIARDHQRIDKLFEQLRERDDSLRLQLVVYPFEETDPVMIEALLRNRLPDAESMSPDELVQRLGYVYYAQRMNAMYMSDPWMLRNYPWMAQMQQPQTPKIGYYKVDPLTRTVYILATEEQHKDINDAIEQLIVAGNQEGVKPVLRRYRLEDSDSSWTIRSLIQLVAPTANLQWIYSYRMDPIWGYPDYVASEFLAYTRESEHEKIEQLVMELNDKTGMGKKELLTITLPEKTPYSRERLTDMLQRVFRDIEPLPGGAGNQLLLWAPNYRLEQIQKTIDEICQPLPEGAQAVAMSYPLQYITVEEATAWLKALYPNASFDPERLTSVQQSQLQQQQRMQQLMFGIRIVQPQMPPQNQIRFPRPDGGQFLIVVATPLEQIEIAKTITELDKDLPESIKPIPRSYALDDLPPGTFPLFNTALTRAFPNAVVTPQQQEAVMVVATEEEHKRVAEFITAYREDSERIRPILEVYTLKRLNFFSIEALLRRIAPPPAWVAPGSKPEQVAVWGTPKEQRDIAVALASFEAATDDESSQNLKVYRTGTGRANITQWLLTQQFPGTLVFPTSQNEVVVWASSSVHEAIGDMMEEIVSAFPVAVLKPYYFEHTPLQDGVTFLRQAFVFTGQATIYQRQLTDDLLVYAMPDVHEEIAAAIKGFDVPRPAATESVSRMYDISDLPLSAIQQTMIQIEVALGYRVQVLQGVVPGQIVVWGKPVDQEKVATFIEQLLTERSAASAEVRTYFVNRGNARTVVDSLITRIAPNAVPYPGTTLNQVVVWAKASDHEKIADAIDRLNENDPNISLKVYRTGSQRALTAQTLLQQQFPELLVTQATPNELVVWATSAEHASISDMLKIVAEAFPDPVLKPYRFRYIPLGEGATTLSQAFFGLATIYQRPSTQDILVFATPDIHERITASIQGFDVPSPETEFLPQAFDLSDLPLYAYWQAMARVQTALGNQVTVIQGVVPGQMIVYGNQANLEKVNTLVEQILDKRADASADMRVYNVPRGTTVASLTTLIPVIAPTAAPSPFGLKTDQILVYAKGSDHIKIEETLEKLEDSQPDVVFVAHSLKNIDAVGAEDALLFLKLKQGLDIEYTYDVYGKQFFVLASEETHEKITDILASLRTEERDMLTVALQRVDLYTAQTAVNTMFWADSMFTKPYVSVDVNTNTLFVEGMEHQLARVRKMLRDMGETVREPNQPDQQQQPNNFRSIQIRGGADTLRDLKKHWEESANPNPLQIIQPEKETPSQFSVEEEVQRESYRIEGEADETPSETGDSSLLVPPVYVIVGEDGTLTITSTDSDALDRLEAFIKRIESGILYEGMDFTVFVIRHISADVVAQRTQQILSLQMASRQQGAATFANQAQQPQFTFDLSANTITVRGSRYWRQEAAKLIAMFDVSDWGGQTARKPISVEIKNTEPNRVLNEVMAVYRSRLMTIRLPGGVMPQVTVNNTKNTLEIIAPEQLAQELKEYAEEIDRKALDEPVRKITVIPLTVKANIVEQALQEVRYSTGVGSFSPMQPGMMIPYNPMQQPMMMPMQPMMPIQPFGAPGTMRGGLQRQF